MRTGAVIAGVVGDGYGFDPITPIGSVSAAQRIAAVLRQAGVDSVVFVTVYNGLKLEKTLADYGVITLYNE